MLPSIVESAASGDLVFVNGVLGSDRSNIRLVFLLIDCWIESQIERVLCALLQHPSW